MNWFELIVAALMAILTGYSSAPVAKPAVAVVAPTVAAHVQAQAASRPKIVQPAAKPATPAQPAQVTWPQPCNQATYGQLPAPTPYPGQFASGGPGSVLTGVCPYLIVQATGGWQMPNGELIPSWQACFTPLLQPYTWQQRNCP